jgi:glycosyl transferase, family 25
MRTYIVNLARSPERRAHMVSELDKVDLEYEFVEGVDGRDLDISDARLVDSDWLREDPYWSGVVGCSLSHLKVYSKVLQTEAPKALVLEDDVVLPDDMPALIEEIAPHMGQVEAILLHHHRRGRAERGEKYRFLSRGSVELLGSTTLAAPADVGDIAGTGAYLITREACERMLNSMLPIRARADDWEFFCQHGLLEAVRCVIPMPVLTNTEFRTTIDSYAANSLQTRLRDAIPRIPLLSKAATIRRQRLLSRRTQVEMVDDF